MHTPHQLNVLAVVALACAAVWPAWCNAGDASDAAEVALPPSHVLDFGCSTGMRGLVFSNDGRSLFLEIRRPNENVRTTGADPASRISEIVAVDVLSGDVGPVFLAQPGMGFAPVVPTADGAALIAKDHLQCKLAFISLTSGRILKTISYAGDSNDATTGWPGVIGLSSDQQTAFIRQSVGFGQHTYVTAVDLNNGERTMILQLGTTRLIRRQLRMIPGAEPRILAFSHWTIPSEPRSLIMHDVTSPGQEARQIQLPASATTKFAFSRDGQRMFIRAVRPDGLLVLDLATGTLEPLLALPEGRRGAWTPVYDDKYDRVFLTTWRPDLPHVSSYCIGVAHVGKHAWVADLAYPTDVMPCQPHYPVVSPDGKTLATACSKRGPTSEGIGQKLLVWDLSALEAPGEGGHEPTDVHDVGQD